jgi:hypothetical protein
VNRALSLVTYLALLLFGLAQGVFGAFFYGAGPAPLAAIGLDLAILATCALGVWGTRTAIGGLAPAVGWFVAVFLLASGTSGGSVVIEASTSGETFLFGGALSAAAGAIIGFVVGARMDGLRSRRRI